MLSRNQVAPPGYGPGFNEQHTQPYLLICLRISGRPLAAPRNWGQTSRMPRSYLHSPYLVHFLSTFASFVYNLSTTRRSISHFSSIFCPLFVNFCVHFVHFCSFSTFLSTFCPLVYFVSTFKRFSFIFLSFSAKFLSTFCPMSIFCPFCLFFIHFVNFLFQFSLFCPLFVHL